MKQPFFKFFPADWRSEPTLRSCSLAARGLWLEMICLMHEAEPRGSLTLNGRQASAKQLANLCGVSLKEMNNLLDELEGAGVFSREDDGTIFSRRMRREAAKSETLSENGQRGGRPSKNQTESKSETKSKANRNQTGNQSPNQTESETQTKRQGNDEANEKPYILEARSLEAKHSKIPEPSARPNARTRSELSAIEAALRLASGLENSDRPKLFDLSPILGFLDAGVSFEETILPVLRAKKGKCDKAASWDWFVPAILEAIEKRQGNAQISAPRRKPPEDPNDPLVDLGGSKRRESEIRRHLAAWLDDKRKNSWNVIAFGFSPDDPGCRVPTGILAEFGLQRVPYPVDDEAAA